jgi:hypothetical protein
MQPFLLHLEILYFMEKVNRKNIAEKKQSRSFVLAIRLILGFGVLGYFFLYNPIKWTIGKHYLKKEGVLIKAVVINRYRPYIGAHHGLDTTCDYQFIIGNTLYKGDTDDSVYSVGDSICVRYWQAFPSINMSNRECISMGWDDKVSE